MGELELPQGVVRFSYRHDGGTLSYLAGSPSLKTEKALGKGLTALSQGVKLL